ncbi:MAG: hypothetical protein KGD61_10810 [Candidatus Lokiarchaeota archaeon]|nr:hypothetical protein [Candidatus Lokiarchaeota archaeon]
MEESFNKRPEHSVDEEIRKFREFIIERRVKWTEEEKIELETDQFDLDEPLQNTGVHFSDMQHHLIDEELRDYFDNDYKIIGFDESSNTFKGTYALLGCFKFGECQTIYSEGKYKKELIMYKPVEAYIEDNDHKLILYRDVIHNFIETVKREFNKAPFKEDINLLEKWFEDTYKKKIDEHIKGHDYYYPSMGHVVDRIRTADEVLKSLIRIKEESNWGKNKNVIFLGDGIQMFRQHIFPPTAFIKFFYDFLKEYEINYYSFSKTCRLRDAQGNFILPIWSSIIEDTKFLVELPDLSKYTKSKAFIARLLDDSSALRFDVPEFCSITDAINIFRNLIPYAPRGYPTCLEGAHKASTLLVSEYNKFEAHFLELKYDVKTKSFAERWRDKVLPP